MPDSPENVIPFAPHRTTLPYPIQVVCDALPIQQIGDQEDLLQFTVMDPDIPECDRTTFCVRLRDLSVSTLTIAYIDALKGYYQGLLREMEV